MSTGTKLSKDQIVEAISTLTVMELSELVKAVEEKFGVKAAAGGMMMAAPAAGGAARSGPTTLKRRCAHRSVEGGKPGSCDSGIVFFTATFYGSAAAHPATPPASSAGRYPPLT